MGESDRKSPSRTRAASGTRPALGRVLVVDDDEGMREALRDLLEEVGYQVVCAKDGAATLEAMRRHRPSVVILDVRLPDLDGDEVRRHQLADPRIARIPVIGLTADVRAKLDPAVPMFVKPFETEDLLHAIELFVAPAASARRP